jgi:N-acetylmuramic acid 6-phosphate (MurNAc-6-P) etherase
MTTRMPGIARLVNYSSDTLKKAGRRLYKNAKESSLLTLLSVVDLDTISTL